MTKKDYERAAQIIRDEIDVLQFQRVNITEVFVMFFKENKRFKPDQFRKAAGVNEDSLSR